MLGLVGCTTMRPIAPVFSRPTRFQVRPPSVDLKMPQPGEIVLRESSSPVPAHTCTVSDGAIASSPIETHFSFSKTGRNVVPALVVFQMPPAAAGGIWKTTNAGTTFRPVFENEKCVSMGELAIAPSDTMQVWAGTGEEDSRNTISPGCGMFKSTDGGLTWKRMGLEKSGAIGRIVVNPKDPNIVYVAALGQAWSANPERGLYKTTDGGQTWQLVKFISPQAGFIDVAMDPSNPEVLFAASWQRVRGPYFLNSGGPGSGLWKTTDAGKTWTEIKGGGFPETTKGRISIAISLSSPQVMYTMVEADTLPNAKPDKTKPRAKSPSGLYRSADGGATW